MPLSSPRARRGRASSEEQPSISKRLRHRTELQCQFCEQNFFKRDHLLRHERSHTQEKPFECALCDKHFSRHDTLLRHVKTIHPPENVIDSSSGDGAQGGDLYREIGNISPCKADNLPPRTLMGDLTENEPQLQLSQDLGISNELLQQPWWLEEDLDLQSFETSLFETTSLEYPWAQLPITTASLNNEHHLLDERVQCQHFTNDAIRKAWFTYVDEGTENRDGIGIQYPLVEPSTEASEMYDLGESFRERVCQKLTTQPNLDPLPSTMYLNHCIRVFFSHYAKLFPVIHNHSFKPSKENSYILLMMGSIGSLLTSNDSTLYGARIFERFNKAILATWENTLLHTPTEATALVQAAFYSEIFGLLSGNPKHLAIVEAFHGTVISWARRCKMFQVEKQTFNLDGLVGAELEQAWLLWAKTESLLRTVYGLYIIDAHLANMFHHEPLLRHDSSKIQSLASDDIFNAPTATQWKILQTQPDASISNPNHYPHIFDHAIQQNEEIFHKASRLTAYFALQSISARISESQGRGEIDYGSEEFSGICNSLNNWYRRYELGNEKVFDPLGLVILWHATYVNLLTDFNKLERALGRDGPSNSVDNDIEHAREWAKSISADRCILHTQVIQQLVSMIALNSDPAIHAAHCVFQAGIAAYSAMHFRRVSMPLSPLPRAVSDFPEFNLHGSFSEEHLASKAAILFQNRIGEQLMRTIGSPREVYHVGADIFRQCLDILQRVGHCGNARLYAGTLLAIIKPEIERWMLG